MKTLMKRLVLWAFRRGLLTKVPTDDLFERYPWLRPA
jgi:hypothetical protein